MYVCMHGTHHSLHPVFDAHNVSTCHLNSPTPPTQVADETGEVQYATQTVTVTERDAKALGQPVGSTTTVLLTAYPGGHGGGLDAAADTTQQFLSPPSTSANVPNVQVVYSAAHVEAIPDTLASSIASISSSIPPQTYNAAAPSSGVMPPLDAAAVVMAHGGTPGGLQDSTDYLNPAPARDLMVGAASNTPIVPPSSAEANVSDIAAQLINEYVTGGQTVPTFTASGSTMQDPGNTFSGGTIQEPVNAFSSSAGAVPDSVSAFVGSGVPTQVPVSLFPASSGCVAEPQEPERMQTEGLPPPTATSTVSS